MTFRFCPHETEFGVDEVPFLDHFGIKELGAKTHNPLEQLEDNLRARNKMRFCCGKPGRLLTCCCGGACIGS